MEKLKQILLEEIPEFKKYGEAFLAGEMSKMDFKKKSGGFGVYAHRDGKSFMIRLRILSGVLSKEQLVLVAEWAEKYAVPMIHLTTRQAVQYHGISLEDVCRIMEEGLAHNIYTRGAGGNFPRNVAMSPLTGIDPEEAFDVLPYAMAANAYFLKQIYTYHLPRKLKVALSSSRQDTAQATAQDLGFVATMKEGKPYFRVFLGGGLGRNPRVGIELPELLPAEKILYAIEAMVNLFKEEGDYENHAKARVRYIADRMGDDAFISCFVKHLEKVSYLPELAFEPVVPKYNKQGVTGHFEHIAVIPQKQKGLFSYFFHPVGGQLDLDILKKINETIKPMEEVYGRLSMDEGLYLINLNLEEVKCIAKLLDENNALLGVDRSRSCIGVPICQMGVLESQETLRAIVDYFKEKEYTKSTLPPLHISGCTNSCGVHQIGNIGLAGKKKKVAGELVGVFDVYMKGSCKLDDTQLGELYGEVLQSKVPECFYQLAIKCDASGKDFLDFVETQKEEVKALLKTYSGA